ncbi:hypothetical protein [Seleniivibrio woodruffii]|uniref:hypothetical protein n=1 Tax=Seleniivibrio woodruffii TaxID=1078050 RepID=UPI0026E99709|nr:hypothetical protein [Seleniivibrio woodruffii]
MQVNLEESNNITIEREGTSDSFIMCIDSRVTVKLSKSEMRLMHALIGAQLQDNPKMGKDALKKVMSDALSANKPKVQEVLRRMKQEDIAFVVWYMGDLRLAHEILSNMSKRSAEDVQETVREAIERRIRKERSTGNTVFESQMNEYGKNVVTSFLKQVFDTDNLAV